MPDFKDAQQRLNSPIAGLHKPPCFSVRPENTVAETVEVLRKQDPRKNVVYIYVTDNEGRLVGVVPQRSLLLASSDTRLAELLKAQRKIITLKATATLNDACELFVLHKYRALPVVNSSGVLLGIVDAQVYTDQMVDLTQDDAVAELFQIIGIHLVSSQNASLLRAFWDRFRWLICTIVGGIFLAMVAGQYESVIEKNVVLAAFIPVALALAESVSIQSVTLATHGWRHGDSFRRIARRAGREMLVGGLLGFASAAILGIVVFIWKGSMLVGSIVFLAIFPSLILSAAIGSLVPLLIRKFSKNPGVASGPVSLVLADVVALIVYLQTARFVIGG